MSRVALDINDSTLTVQDGSQSLYREPGFALLLDDGLQTGTAAFKEARINPRRIQNRFWSSLTTEPLADRRFAHISAADLVSRQLEDITARVNADEWVVVVPAYLSSQHLGLFLGIAAEVGMNIVAMVDSAVSATRREYVEAVPVHVDVGLHHATMVRLAQPGRVQAERSEILEGCGTYALYEAWLSTVAEAFVQQSRFDPLHTAETEQVLVNNLARWLGEAARAQQVQMQIDFRGKPYEATVESLKFIGAAAPIYQQIASKLRALYRADEMPALQISDRVARLPGLAEMLKARVGGEIFMLETGAAGRGALARCRGSDAGTGVTLIRQLPWDQAAMALEVVQDDAAQSGAPTHLLFENTAYTVGNSALIIGSESTEAGRSLVVDPQMPGVSRKHCRVQLKNGQCVLEDESRYGTFLNGHRIDGSSTLQIGDTVRVGSPGYEFRMITTDEDHG